MAVPKKKTSPSRRGHRNSSNHLKPVNVIEDKNTGEYRLQHHMADGMYKGRKVAQKKEQVEENK